MDEPRWLTRKIVDAIHADQLKQHGGLPGARDEGAVESALARPKHLQTYGDDPSVHRLAAAYGAGLARNHGYRDGNKRTAFMAMYVFLRLNDQQVDAKEAVVVDLMKAVAQGDCEEEELTAWLDGHTVSIGAS
ncbi:type II toxin-antitoxin system death-on-curing family toxin [Salinibacter ruber]|uniref:type II toxin-antitoxin system death-on-curing family toxin n=1 Tax=Salinibacter ruber TaxID=146919 RepID=UPI002166D79D|nr:type II toxin-antitoxin system death-on-curing family toxin [Salinibacter ruber]MCS3750792.1 death-on-curing protein [Salinibacter ruber]MCS3757804.1 death-on-curing protein [Salinibacter ruber]MCS3954458.1 death-on-curing protein [Salinibacter ruber]MCS4041159.1 death-on-curing protein [Salinibacter ruber]MCS4086417.1 death-on-curing protein [Salinibacter ruber]